MGLNLKKNKAFKVIITTLLVIAFTVSVISCKEATATGEQQEMEEELAEEEEAAEEEEEEEISIDSALETTLKEKVSFISEALPGAELNTKTGELTAKDKNEWGIKEGESIGWYVVNAFKMETADGVEEEQDAIGLIPSVIEAMQDKILEENKESFLPIPVNLKEVKDVKITELKIASGEFFQGVINLGMNVPIGTVIHAPRSSAWEFSYLRDFWGGDINDKTLFSSYDIDEDIWWQYYMQFNEGKIVADLDRVGETYIMEKDGKERTIPLNVYEVSLGEPILEITGEASLDETANRINNLIYSYENPGEYQFYFGGFLSSSERGIEPTKILELGKESQKVKVFISPIGTAHEQTK
jgi:hypothetical protein